MNALQHVAPQRKSRAQRLVEEVCLYYEIDEEVLRQRARTCGCPKKKRCLCGRSPRSGAYAEGRMMACYLLSEEMSMPRTRIGFLLNRDHSTINHNVCRLQEMLPHRRDLRRRLEEIRALLRERGVLLGEA